MARSSLRFSARHGGLADAPALGPHAACNAQHPRMQLRCHGCSRPAFTTPHGACRNVNAQHAVPCASAFRQVLAALNSGEIPTAGSVIATFNKASSAAVPPLAARTGSAEALRLCTAAINAAARDAHEHSPARTRHCACACAPGCDGDRVRPSCCGGGVRWAVLRFGHRGVFVVVPTHPCLLVRHRRWPVGRRFDTSASRSTRGSSSSCGCRWTRRVHCLGLALPLPRALCTPQRCPNTHDGADAPYWHTHVRARAHTSLTLTSPQLASACVCACERTHARTLPIPNICISGGMVSHTGTVSRTALYPMRDACTPHGAGMQTLRSFMRSP